MHFAKGLYDDAKSYVQMRIHETDYLFSHYDVDGVCAWVARSALILARQRIAMGVRAAASALPLVSILLSPESWSFLPSTRDERLALGFMSHIRHRRDDYNVSINFVGFINPAYLELDSVTPHTCDWQQNQSDTPPLTAEEWYRTWK